MEKESFPTFSGDFFTYADRDDNYWSGFYTSRPFHKSMERSLESYVRSAEIIFSIGCILNKINQKTKEALSQSLKEARLNLDIFQHHDGITGTSKNVVVNDYSARFVYLFLMTPISALFSFCRLFKSIQNCQAIIVEMVSSLMHLPSGLSASSTHMVEIIPNHYSLPFEDTLALNQEQKRFDLA